MSFSKPNRPNKLEELMKSYSHQLQRRPVVTKAVTSSVILACGNIASQLIAPPKHGRIEWRSVLSYLVFGFVLNGPLIHQLYVLIDKWIPPSKEKNSYTAIKRVLLDRFVFAPPYLLMFYYVISILEGAGSAGAIQKIRESFISALIMNWKIWTIFQYVNLNYVPQKYRVLFGNGLAFLWTIYLARKRRLST